MLSWVSVVGILDPAPAMITIMYVLPVNMSMNAVNCELRTSMPRNWLCDLEQLILNCLMMFEMRSKR